MKVAAFGWYGHDNAGDERIKFCLDHFLMRVGGIASLEFFDLHENAINGATDRFNAYDLVIIGGGGLILSQANYHDFILSIKTKIVTLGISVETALKGNPKHFALALLEKSHVFIVRDQNSADKLNGLYPGNKVSVSSDLSFLAPYDRVLLPNTGAIGVNLLPKPRHLRYSALSNPYLSFIIRQFLRFGFSDILQMVDFTNLLEHLKAVYPISPIPLYCAPKASNVPLYQKNDVDFLKLYFEQVPEQFCDNHIDNCDVFLSMRLHGSIFAVQKGIPMISFSYLPKNRNFMKEAGLENFVIDSIEPKSVLSLIDKSIQTQAILRDNMSAFTLKASEKINRDLLNMLNKVI